MPNFNDSMKAKVAPAAINTGLARPAGTGSTNDLLYTLWGGSTGSINDAGNTYFNTVTPSGPAFRSISEGQSTLGTFTMAVPTGTASGDQLLMFVQVFGDYKSYIAGSPSAGWTQIALDDGYRIEIPAATFVVYKRTATASESTYSWSGGANWDNGMGFVMAISGATAVDVVGAFGRNSAAPFSAPSVTTTTSTDLLVYAFANLNNTAFTKPAPMTERANATPTIAHFRTLIATETLTASGATGVRTATETLSTSGLRTTSLLIAVE